jgi:hypothetical protein
MTPVAWIALGGIALTLLLQTLAGIVWLVRLDARSQEDRRRLDRFIDTTNHKLSKLGDKVTAEVGHLTGLLIDAGLSSDRRRPRED